MTHQQPFDKAVTEQHLQFLQLDFEAKLVFLRESNLDMPTQNLYLESTLTEMADFYHNAP
ncbi:MAG: hypothetical protein RL329_3796, partial [Bacteroidota bacterium]